MRILLVILILAFTGICYLCMGNEELEDRKKYYEEHPPIYFEYPIVYSGVTINVSPCAMNDSNCLLLPLSDISLDSDPSLQGISSGDNQALMVEAKFPDGGIIKNNLSIGTALKYNVNARLEVVHAAPKTTYKVYFRLVPVVVMIENLQKITGYRIVVDGVSSEPAPPMATGVSGQAGNTGSTDSGSSSSGYGVKEWLMDQWYDVKNWF